MLSQRRGYDWGILFPLEVPLFELSFFGLLLASLYSLCPLLGFRRANFLRLIGQLHLLDLCLLDNLKLFSQVLLFARISGVESVSSWLDYVVLHKDGLLTWGLDLRL